MGWAKRLKRVFGIEIELSVVKDAPAGTTVTMVAAALEAFVRVRIDDDGPGLPPGDLDPLFAKFHRGRDKSSAGGAGLGLSICRAIVTAHGGKIQASQRPGGGALFSFTRKHSNIPVISILN